MRAAYRRRLAAAAWLLLGGTASALLGTPEFRAPAIPLVVQSPFASIWASSGVLNAGWTTHWSGAVMALAGLVRVDGVTYRWCGVPTAAQSATQVNATVWATTSRFFLTAGGVGLDVRFTTPSMANASLDVLSRPASYMAVSARSIDGQPHRVQLYFDVTGEAVTASSSTAVSWARYNLTGASTSSGRGPRSANASHAALRIGATTQSLLGTRGDGTKISWGYVYVIAQTGGAGEEAAGSVSATLIGSDLSRAQFNLNGTIPSRDDPAASRAVSDTWIAAAVAWELGVLQPGAAPVTKVLTLFFDEVLVLDFHGVKMPPHWRRGYPVGDHSIVPRVELTAAVDEYELLMAQAAAWDRYIEVQALRSTGGHAGMAAVSSLVYRQTMGACTLAWHPVKRATWFLLKEISSNGFTSTADVVYPAAPFFLVHNPELLKGLLVPVLELAAGRTSAAYTVPWAPDQLGTWPYADVGSAGQEDMPVMASSLYLVLVAAVVQRGGGDAAWLASYWSALRSWGDYLATELPFPGNQLSTDDSVGPLLPNNTNLALLGAVGMAAYGFLQHAAGDAAGANATWSRAGTVGAAWVDYGWVADPTGAAGGPHSRLQLRGTPSAVAGASDVGWSLKYHALWVRVLGFDTLLPSQAALLEAESAFYLSKLNALGLPQDSRQTFAKGAWNLWCAAAAYNGSGYASWPRVGPEAIAGPSRVSTALFDALTRWVHTSPAGAPLSDWFQTAAPGDVVAFRARPVWGAAWAPALLSLAAVPIADGGLGMRSGGSTQAALAAARERMARGHYEYSHPTAPTPLPSTYRNPVHLASDTADPGVAWDELSKRWYAATTTGGSTATGGRFNIFVSQTLAAWTWVATAFPVGWGGSPAWATGDFWAPELWRNNLGQWLIYYTARHTNGQLSIGVGVSSSGTPLGPFNDVGAPLITDPTMGYIDCTYAWDPASNAPWLLFKKEGNAVGVPTPIHIAQLRADGLALAPGQDALWRGTHLITNTLPWEGDLVEAPWVTIHNSSYYLWYSGNGYLSGYAVSVARAASITGPYTKLTHRLLADSGASSAPWQAPGHCSVVRVPSSMRQGSLAAAAAAANAGAEVPANPAPYSYAMVYHAWVGAGRSSRLMLLDAVDWATNLTGDGTVWPVMAASQVAAARAGVPVLPAFLPRYASTGSAQLPFGTGQVATPSVSPSASSSPVTAPGCPSAFTAANTVAGTLSHGLRAVSLAQAGAPASTYLRHGCFWAYSMPISLGDTLAVQDATSIVRLGMDGAPGGISLASANMPSFVLAVQPDGYVQYTAAASFAPTRGAEEWPSALDPASATWEVVAMPSGVRINSTAVAIDVLGSDGATIQLRSRAPGFRGQTLSLGTAGTHVCGALRLNLRVAPAGASTPSWTVHAGGVAAPSLYAAAASTSYVAAQRVLVEPAAASASSALLGVAASGSVTVSTLGRWLAYGGDIKSSSSAGSRVGWQIVPPLACVAACTGGQWALVSLRSAWTDNAYLTDASAPADAAAGVSVQATVACAGDAVFTAVRATLLVRQTTLAGVSGWLLAPASGVDPATGLAQRLFSVDLASGTVSVVTVTARNHSLQQLWRPTWDDGAGSPAALPALTAAIALAAGASVCPSPSGSGSATAAVTASTTAAATGSTTPFAAATSSSSATATRSATAAASVSPSAASTASATGTGSATAAATSTSSATLTSSGTRTAPATSSLTASVSASTTASHTQSGTASFTMTATATVTAAASFSGSGSTSAAPSVTGTARATASRTVSSSAATRSRAASGSATRSHHTRGASASGSGTAPLSGSKTLNALPSRPRTPSRASESRSRSLTRTASVTATRSRKRKV